MKTYTWGLDLSGNLQGAGGVGGLLAVSDLGSQTSGLWYPTYDANGNVSEYIDNNGNTVAHYEYSPFGRLTAATGDKAADFNHRFSTKYQNNQTGLYYYGYRYYSAELGRWLSRDPIGEIGGVGGGSQRQVNIMKLKTTLNNLIKDKKRLFTSPPSETVAKMGIDGSVNTMRDVLKQTTTGQERIQDIDLLTEIKRNLLNTFYTGTVGFPNAYLMIQNQTVGKYDFCGLKDKSTTEKGTAKWVKTVNRQIIKAITKAPGKTGRVAEVLDKALDIEDAHQRSQELDNVVEKWKDAAKELRNKSGPAQSRWVSCYEACREMVQYFGCETLRAGNFCVNVCDNRGKDDGWWDSLF